MSLYTQHPEALVLTSVDLSHVTLENTLCCLSPVRGLHHQGNKDDRPVLCKRKEYLKSHSHACTRGKQTTIWFCSNYATNRRSPNNNTVIQWSPEAEQALQDSFEITDWKALQGFHGENVEEMVNAPQAIFSSMDTVVQASSVSCFANIKTWITGDLKDQR